MRRTYPGLRYVERNPARAHLVTAPGNTLSSARAHCTGEDPTGLLDLADWRTDSPGETWANYLTVPEPPGEPKPFRLATTVGRPLGSEAFITRLEVQIGRRLHPYSVGRPQKEAMENDAVDRNHGDTGVCPCAR